MDVVLGASWFGCRLTYSGPLLTLPSHPPVPGFICSLCRSYRPFWGAKSAITSAASGVWAVFAEIYNGLCSSIDNGPSPLVRVGVTCGGLICGVPAALTAFGYSLFFRRGTKVFSAAATDEDVEAFCSSTAAMGVTSIEIGDGNSLITKRTLDTISGKCFWLTKIKITGATSLDGTWQEGMWVEL